MVCLSRPYPSSFLKPVFHKFYLVHSWKICPISSFGHFYYECIFYNFVLSNTLLHEKNDLIIFIYTFYFVNFRYLIM